MQRSKRNWLVSGGVGVLIAGLGAGCDAHAGAPPAPPPPKVGVLRVATSDVPLYIDSVATLDGFVNAEIRARVHGYLERQAYADGAPVKRGQLLFSIEASPYRSAANAAKATLERARANRDRARSQLERDRPLARANALSQQDLENAAADAADAEARVHEAEAALERAQLDLSYTQIRSPLDGVSGLALVRAGNLVGQDTPTLLTTVSTIDPMRVTFSIGELDFVSDPHRFAVNAGGEPEQVELLLADGSTHPWRGKVIALNRQLDASTGTISVQALFPNPEGALRPGQYGRVRLRRRDAGRAVLAVPDRALLRVQQAYALAVLGPDDKVQLRNVELGPAATGLQIIDKGLAEGERVVVDGAQKVSEGQLVAPQPLATAAVASPTGTLSSARN